MSEPELLEACALREIKCERVGNMWRITGRGVSLLTTDLRYLRVADLQPHAATVLAPNARDEGGPA